MYNRTKAQEVLNALAGVMPASALPLAFAAAAHESNGFNSPLSNDNNFTGLTISSSSATQAATGAAIGRKQPDGAGYYASYPGVNNWAADYYRFLCFNKGAGRPIDSTGIEDFAHRLKVNGFYGDTETNYVNALYRWSEELKNDFPEVFGNNGIVNKIADAVGLNSTPIDEGNDPQNTTTNTMRNNVIIVGSLALIIFSSLVIILSLSKK